MLRARRAAACGFDIVIGNPPYVRQEWFKKDKAVFKESYHCHAGAADLYVYFYERSLDLLRIGAGCSASFRPTNTSDPAMGGAFVALWPPRAQFSN